MDASPSSPPLPPLWPPYAPEACMDEHDASNERPQSYAGYGVALAAFGSLICSLAMLIGKRSADVEADLPLCKRWRWWTFFVINTTAEVSISSVALMLAPLSLIAPCNGLAVIFSALLARMGCIANIKERLTLLEWASLVLALVGIVCCSLFGPSEPSRVLPFAAYGEAFASPAFLVYACVAVSIVGSWLILLCLPGLRRRRQQAERSFIFPLVSAYGAGTCSSFSIVWQNIFVHALSAALGDLGWEVVHHWVAWASIAGLIACAPTQLYLLNAALATGKASYTVPVYTVNSITNGIVVSGLLFHDFDCLGQRQSILFFSSFGVVILGVAVLSSLQGQRASEALNDLRASRSGIGPNDTRFDLDGDELTLQLQRWNLRTPIGGVSALYCIPERVYAARQLRRTFSAGDLRITPSPMTGAAERLSGILSGADQLGTLGGPSVPARLFVSRSTGHLPSDLDYVLPRRGVQATYDGVLRTSALDSSSSLASGLLPHPTATIRQQRSPASTGSVRPDGLRPLPPAPGHI